MQRLLGFSRTALVIMVALAIVACERTEPRSAISPSGDETPQIVPTILPCPPTHLAGAKNDTIATKRIGPDGGTIHLSTLIKVRFPEGALAAETDITIRLIRDERVLFAITPADLVLSRPAVITVDHLDRMDSQRFAGLALYRAEGLSWQQLPSGRNKYKIDGTSGMLGVFSIAQALGDAAKGASSAEGSDDIQMLRWLSGPAHDTKLIEAAKGGEVQVGRYKVKIPKQALAEDTYVTVRDPGTGYLMCELEPHGIEFALPVELEMNIDGLDVGDYTDWTIFWFNEDAGRWEDQGADYSISGHKLTATLMHFSRYAGGRAGW